MLANEPGSLRSVYSPDYVLFDLETTGFSYKTDSIIEISALRVRDGEITEEFSHLVNPMRELPWRITQITNITPDMLYDKPTIDDVMPGFIDFIGDDLLVGHNIHSFDMKFIYKNCREIFRQVPDNDYADSLLLAKKYMRELSNHKLSDLALYLNLSTDNAHRALYDCRMNQAVYEELGRRMNSLNK